MSIRSRFRTWARGVFHRAALDLQLSDELQFHIESYAEDLIRGGVSPEEAMRRARAEFGSIAARREDCRAAWGTRFLDDSIGDLRYAFRMLARKPGFALIAVGSLALGIGANTVIFTAALHMLFDRLNVPHPEQLRLLQWNEVNGGVVDDLWGNYQDVPDVGKKSTSFSYPVYEQLRKQSGALESLFAFKPLDRQTVSINGRAIAVPAEMVSGNYYTSLGVRPQIGRGIQDSDDSAVGSGPVVVISDRLWTREFGRSPSVLGRSILLNMTLMTIVGVNPPGFTGAYSAQGTPDIFFPLSMQPIVVPMKPGGSKSTSLLANNNFWWVMVMGRSKAGSVNDKGEASLDVAFNAAVRGTMTVTKDGQVPHLVLLDGSRGQNPSADDLSQPVYVLMGLSGLVLLLACVNLANLLLAQASARQREMSVRLALGAGRWRILRQMMTESLILSVMGGAAGLALAYMVRDAIPKMMSDAWSEPAFSAGLDWRIFGFAVGVSVLTSILFGFAPAWAATRVQVSSGLKEAAQTTTHRRRGLAGKLIVVIEVAFQCFCW